MHRNIVKHTEHGGTVGSFRIRERAGSYLEPAEATPPDMLSLSNKMMVKCLTLGDNSYPPLPSQFTVHSSPDDAALNIPNC